MCNTNNSFSMQLLHDALLNVEAYCTKLAKIQGKKQRKAINKLPFILKGNGIKD